MKDTQGNIITEEEFTKDIGHRAESHHYCCATQDEGECNCKLIVNTSEDSYKPPEDKEDTWQARLRISVRFDRNQDREVCILLIQELIDKAYKLGMCVGHQKESEMWSEIVKMIKNNK